MKDHPPSYHFVLDYFQLIMDIDFEELNWHVIGRRRAIIEMVQQYKKQFGLQAYSNRQIWEIIKRKHDMWFDCLLDDVLK